MLRDLWRFRTSLLPGLGIAMGLLGFAGLLFWVLIHSGGESGSLSFDHRIVSLLKFTLLQATLSTILSLIVGLLLAWSLTHQPRFRGRAVLIALFSSSLVLPTLIVAFGIISVLGNHGWLNQLIEWAGGHTLGSFVYGLGGILVAHVYLNASFAAMGLLQAFESIPVDKYRLAKSLGLSPWQRFRTVEWVALRGSLPSIGATIFLLCFSSFAIVLLLGGSPSYNTLEVAIYEAVRIDFDIPFALRLAWIQLGISAVLVLFTSRLRSGLQNLKESSRAHTWHDTFSWSMFQRTVIVLLAVLYLLPLIAVLLDGLHADLLSIVTRPLFVRSLWMSLVIASASALLTVALSLMLSDARRHFGAPFRLPGTRLTRLLSLAVAFSGNLYLAIPSLILGLGFFLIARMFGGSMEIWALVAITTANVLMSLPFALSVMVPAMQKTAQRYDKLVFSLGLSAWSRWRHAEWPYLRRSVAYIGALSFALSLGDLGVVALFGNREITTLPWYLYQLMGSYRNQDAAGVALVLLLLVGGVFFVVNYERKKEGAHDAVHP
jgi:thiamine transport system permease protein